MRYITKTCPVCVRSKHLSFLLKTESVTEKHFSTKKHFIKCCKAGGFSLSLIIYLQQVYWECGRRGGVYTCRGAPVFSQYYDELFQKKKTNREGGCLRAYVFENPLEFLFTPRNCTMLCYIPQKF